MLLALRPAALRPVALRLDCGSAAVMNSDDFTEKFELRIVYGKITVFSNGLVCL